MSKNSLIDAMSVSAYIILGVVIINLVIEFLLNKFDTLWLWVCFFDSGLENSYFYKLLS